MLTINADAQLYVIGGLLLVVALAAAVLTSWQLSRSISRGADTARAAAQRIGEGDLSHRVSASGTDEIGLLLQALSTMQDNLTRVVSNVRQGSESVAGHAAKCRAGGGDGRGGFQPQNAGAGSGQRSGDI